MSSAPIIVVFMLGLFMGSGLVLRHAGPFVFYYIMMPIISAIACVLLLEQIQVPGIDLQYDRYLPIVLRHQSGLVWALLAGFAAGIALKWLSKRMFTPQDRRKTGPRTLIDPTISMDRKKSLAVLGLTNSAGPREIMTAWASLSGQIENGSRSVKRLRRATDPSPMLRKQQIDAAYEWLSRNPYEG